MTTPLDRTLPATATRLIAKFGVAATLFTHESVAYNPATRGVDGEPTSTPVIITPFVPIKREFGGDDTIEDHSAEAWTAGPALTALGLDPKPGDIVQYTSGATFRITRVEKFYSGDVVAAYRLIGTS